jgi:hypothetical protein
MLLYPGIADLFRNRLWRDESIHGTAAFPRFGIYRSAHLSFPRNDTEGFIYTMNVTEEQLNSYGIGQHVVLNESYLKRIFGASESLLSFDTYQFDDYTKVVANRFDPGKKAKRRKEIFPKDCEQAFEMGVKLAKIAC